MEKALQKLNRLKQRIKTAAIISGVAVSSFGITSNAAAKDFQNKDDNKSAVQIHSPEQQIKLDDNLQKYFYADGADNGIYIEPEDIAKCLSSAGISAKSPELDKFCESYLQHTDENNKISFWGLSQVMEESLQPEQSKAFCDALLQTFKAPKTKAEKTHTENAASSIEQETEWKTVKNDKASIKYNIGAEGISVRGNLLMNVSGLLPQTYALKNGQYKCGTSSHFKLMTARKLEMAKIQKVVMEHYVYNDLLNSGDASNPVVERFLNKHCQDMQKHGLSVDEKGNFVQKDKPNNLQLMQKAKAQTR